MIAKTSHKGEILDQEVVAKWLPLLNVQEGKVIHTGHLSHVNTGSPGILESGLHF